MILGTGGSIYRNTAHVSLERKLAQLDVGARARFRADNPTSFAQQRLWMLWRLFPGPSAYAAVPALDIHGPLDFHDLQRAFHTVARHQEALRTVFPEVDGEPIQAVL